MLIQALLLNETIYIRLSFMSGFPIKCTRINVWIWIWEIVV